MNCSNANTSSNGLSGAAALRIWERAHRLTKQEFEEGRSERFLGAMGVLGDLKLALIDAIATDEAGAIGRMLREHRALSRSFSKLNEAVSSQAPL